MVIYSFPYAGGGAIMYSKLKKKLNAFSDWISIEYPGHGKRNNENLIKSMDELVDDAYLQFINKYNNEDFIFLGYSMGASVVYELIKRIKGSSIEKNLKHVILCASDSPEANAKIEDISEFNDDKLLEYTINLGGSNIKNDKEYKVYRSFLPIIRNDFVLFYNYKKTFHEETPFVIETNVSVFYSDEEKSVEGYKIHCGGKCDFQHFDGGHFFINNENSNLESYIKKIIIREEQ